MRLNVKETENRKSDAGIIGRSHFEQISNIDHTGQISIYLITYHPRFLPDSFLFILDAVRNITVLLVTFVILTTVSRDRHPATSLSY